MHHEETTTMADAWGGVYQIMGSLFLTLLNTFRAIVQKTKQYRNQPPTDSLLLLTLICYQIKYHIITETMIEVDERSKKKKQNKKTFNKKIKASNM